MTIFRLTFPALICNRGEQTYISCGYVVAGHAIALGIWGRVLFYTWRPENPALFSMPFPFPGPALNRSDYDVRYQIPQEYDNPECEIVHGLSLAFWPGHSIHS